MIRTFVALEIPEEVKHNLFDLRKKIIKNDFNLKWEPKEKIHITLKFIGDIKEELILNVISDLKFLESFNKIKCEINKFGFFFRDGIPKILWTSIELSQPASEIVSKLNSTFLKYGIDEEKRKFKPHLTLLRLKENPGQNFIDTFIHYKFDPINFEAEKIILYKSELQKSCSKYFEIKIYNLN